MLNELIATVESSIAEVKVAIADLYLFREAAALANDQTEVERFNDLILKEQQGNEIRKRQLRYLLAFRPHFEAGRDKHMDEIARLSE
jgi:hypothetical protein